MLFPKNFYKIAWKILKKSNIFYKISIMASILNTNTTSINSQRHLYKAQSKLNNSLQRLSSGLRINSAQDDAAGLAISQRMTAQINGLNVAQKNTNDAISYSQTAEGALAEMGDILQRIRELSVQSANATNSASDRKSLNDEVNQLVSELNRFAITTEFNGQKILNGDNNALSFHVGANANQTITATSSDFRTDKYGSYQIGGEQICTAGAGATEVLANGVAKDGATIKGEQVAQAAVSADGVLTLNGCNAAAAVSLTTSDSAADIAQKINSQDLTGIKASAKTEALFFVGATGSYTVNVWTSNASSNSANTNAVSISFNLNVVQKDELADMVNAFNEVSSKTGITAKINKMNSKFAVILTNDEGKNINVQMESPENNVGGIALGNLTDGNGRAILPNNTGTITVAGQVLLDAERSYSITTEKGLIIQAGVLSGDVMGAADKAITYGSELKRVDSIDITTVKGANQAIHIVDMALDAVNSQRAKFGALQNRFEHTISNLQTSAENISASRSRIQDADYANETANLSRNQVLQQAATSMLAQANQLPSNILSLLG